RRTRVTLEQAQQDLGRALSGARLASVARVLALRRRAEREAAALGDRPVEQPARLRGEEQRVDVLPTCRLAEDRHVARIAAERRDVVPHPAERAHGVEGAEVSRCVLVAGRGGGERGMAEPAERTEPVLNRDDDEVMRRGEVAALVKGRAAD